LDEPAWPGPVGRVGSTGSLISEVPIGLEAIVSVCFEAESRHKINGVAVRCRDGFGIFSSDPACRRLEDGTIPNARAVVRSFARLGAPA
jgi:hypothetical protein